MEKKIKKSRLRKLKHASNGAGFCQCRGEAKEEELDECVLLLLFLFNCLLFVFCFLSFLIVCFVLPFFRFSFLSLSLSVLLFFRKNMMILNLNIFKPFPSILITSERNKESLNCCCLKVRWHGKGKTRKERLQQMNSAEERGEELKPFPSTQITSERNKESLNFCCLKVRRWRGKERRERERTLSV